MLSNEYQTLNIPSSDCIEKHEDHQSLTAKIASYLRLAGSLLIIISAISFMLQGHAEIIPAYRYWTGLGLVLLLCGGGLICAYLFKETKGARIFFGLAAAFLPVQISQVSAMIYSYRAGQTELKPLYNWLEFIEVSPSIIALNGIISIGLLIMVGYAGFAILARKHIHTLMLTSVIGNAVLLMPVRDTSITPYLIASLFIFSRSIERKLHADSTMRLAEGLAARALVSLPLWIIIGRSLLYPVSDLLAVVLSLFIVVYCFFDLKRYTRSAFLLYIAQWLGTLSAIICWFFVLALFGESFTRQPATVMPVAIILFALSGQVAYHARTYRFVSSIIVLILNYDTVINQQTMSPVFSIASGIFLTVTGIKLRDKWSLFSGNLCMVGGLFRYSIELYTSAPWTSSIALGLVVILLASYLENKQQLILAKSRYYFNEFKHWH